LEECEEELDVAGRLLGKWPMRSTIGGRQLESFCNSLSYRIFQPINFRFSPCIII